ncbi:dTDP-4-dehydrorhamnose 3,5-epimerase [hydrothermal vent metagenome]|uniref:dTDP-4-dehydrorhamnose 3,5-epimerase n=1 Tax=hydrothermal vent metagenome TaxID=652676 RepID=A0A3B0XDG3_9ZZZZ
MKITPAEIPEILIIEPDVYGDSRGFFMETWNQKIYAECGLDVDFVQDNYSRSEQGVLRGLHYQLEKPQGKLVRVSNGVVFDVAVDVRVGSPTFSQYCAIELSADNFKQLYIPPGFAHGFCVLSESADFIYKCTDFYAPEYEHGILWNDPAISIEWPATDFKISEKDANNKLLKDMSGQLPVYIGSL